MNIQLENVVTEGQFELVESLAEQIWNEYYISIITQEQIDYMLATFQSKEAIQQQVETGYQYFIINNEEGEAVGYTAVKPEDGKLFLSKLYVSKDQRGKGYGSAALTAIKQLAQEQACTTIWLTVNRHNEASISTYKRNGFTIAREQVADIGNGYVMDDYILEFQL